MALKQFIFAQRTTVSPLYPHAILWPDDTFDGGGNLTFDGETLWTDIVRAGNVVGGEYSGGLVLDDLGDPSDFQTLVTIGEFLTLFTPVELRLLRDMLNGTGGESEDDDVLLQWTILTMIDFPTEITTPEIVTAVDQFETSGALTSPRHDAILQGVPISYL